MRFGGSAWGPERGRRIFCRYEEKLNFFLKFLKKILIFKKKNFWFFKINFFNFKKLIFLIFKKKFWFFFKKTFHIIIVLFPQLFHRPQRSEFHRNVRARVHQREGGLRCDDWRNLSSSKGRCGAALWLWPRRPELVIRRRHSNSSGPGSADAGAPNASENHLLLTKLLIFFSQSLFFLFWEWLVHKVFLFQPSFSQNFFLPIWWMIGAQSLSVSVLVFFRFRRSTNLYKNHATNSDNSAIILLDKKMVRSGVVPVYLCLWDIP